MSSSSTITSPTDLLTLSDLYASSSLPAPEDKPSFPLDAELNKRVSIWRGRSLTPAHPLLSLREVGDITKLKVSPLPRSFLLPFSPTEHFVEA
jgi:hypothetical protein